MAELTIADQQHVFSLINGKKPKVALLHFSAPPVISGVDVMIRDQARMFRQFGYKIEIIAGTGRQFRHDIPVHIIKSIGPRHPKVVAIREELEKGIISKSFYQLEQHLYKTIKAYLCNHGIQVCILHNVMIRHYNMPLTSALNRLTHDLPQIRFIAWVHDTLFSDNPYLFIGQPTIKSFPWTLLTTPLDAVTYVCVNEYCKNNLLAVFSGKAPKSLVVIHNAIDVPKFLGLTPVMRQFYADIDGLGSDLIGLVPVRAVPRKNLELSLAIAAELVLKGVNFKLLMTANVDYKRPEYLLYYNKLKDTVKTFNLEKHVYFMEEHFQKYKTDGAAPLIPMSDAYRISDFLLMTSAMDGFGLPLLEAGVHHVPIFASDIAPYREIGTTNINYFSLMRSPKEIARFILDRMARMPQAYFYRKVIRFYSLYAAFQKHILPLVNSLVRQGMET